jgi:hypothetical protein
MTVRPRRQWILIFAVAAAAALVATAWLAMLTAPGVAPPNLPVAHATDLQVEPGIANAVVFPFQLAPDSQSSEDGAGTVSSASVSATLSIAACQLSAPGGCTGVYLEVLSADQLTGVPSPQNLTPIWCTNASGSCGLSTGGTFQIDLTSYAGQALDLVVWSPSGVEWANLDAHGTWSA